MKFKTKHTFAESAIWLGVAVLILIYGVVILQQSPHIPLLFSIAVIVLYGVTHKVSWSEIREGIIYNISESIEAILIILWEPGCQAELCQPLSTMAFKFFLPSIF